MKLMTVLGTRPEIIRLSRVIEKLDTICEHILVHTGQNYDPNMNEIFFQEMGIRSPDFFLAAKGTLGEQIGTILSQTEALIKSEKPDKFLILGDTNSALSVIMAKRLGIPVYHMEAGNRCYDDRVPEEVNRRIIDHSSDVLIPYTERSRQNLLREGIPGQRVFVSGNPIYEVLESYKDKIDSSDIFNKLGVQPKSYFLITLHRAENVDIQERLVKFIHTFDMLQRQYKLPVIVSTHPRTKSQMQSLGLENINPDVRYLPPFGLFDFVALEKNARMVLSDSGTVQEECCIYKVPNITIRDVTERPETIECGSNILRGAEPESIINCAKLVMAEEVAWNPPPEYLAKNVSNTIIKILTGYIKK